LGGAVTLSTVAEDAGFTNMDAKSAANKVSAHIHALEELYVMESIKGWDAPIRSKSRLRTKPKYVFSDVSLAASLLNLTPERLMTDGQTFGVLFESLCLHDLAVYASVLPEAEPEPLRYYRDSDGLEVDAILELRDGRWAGIEIKLGDNKVPEGISSLLRLKQKIAANPAARNPEPAFLAVIVGAGEYARFDRTSGVYIIPLTALGA
jgi:predicted AAA+ superfamily ATPase